jgi:hypothetical protein
VTYNRIHIEYTNYLGIKETTDLTKDQIKKFVTGKSRKEIVARLDNACKHYANNYWVSGYINDKKVCWHQWNQV